MDNTKNSKALSFFEQHAFAILLMLWLLFGCLAIVGVFFSLSKFSDANETSPKSVLDYLNVSYVAAGALFTGFAFAITYLSLKHQSSELKKQNERLEKQISIDVFSDAFGHVLDVDKFREAKKYIYSNQFREAVDELVSSRSQNIKQLIHAERSDFEEKKQHINQSGDNEESKKNRIAGEIINHNNALRKIRNSDEYKATERQFCIEDFKRIIISTTPINEKGDTSYEKKNESNQKDASVNDASAHGMIVYFCDRMEYLGFIHYTYNSKEEIGEKELYLIIDYFGYDIINTFEKLKPFIHANREEKNSGNPYYHFEFLYLLASQRKNNYLQECENELKRLSKKSNNQQIK